MHLVQAAHSPRCLSISRGRAATARQHRAAETRARVVSQAWLAVQAAPVTPQLFSRRLLAWSGGGT